MSFVEVENIRRYRRLLETETDPAKRTVLEGLVAEEKAKLTAERSAARKV